MSTHKDLPVGRRPRLLFLSWHFPPARSVACIRTWNTAKHLARLGWDVTVVTPDPALWRTVENATETERDLEREGIRRILTSHRWRCLTPDTLRCWNKNIGWLAGGICRHVARRLGIDPGVGWITEAETACAYLRTEDVDVILASGPPFAAFSLARLLSDRLDRPYVLDYRDPWTGSPHSERSTSATLRRERRLLTGSAAVTIVSHSWARALDRRFGVGSRLHVVTNGYDPEDLAGVQPEPFDHFAIVYAGIFYSPKRVISPVMAALKALDSNADSEHRRWRFHYYGPHQDHVSEEATRAGIAHRVLLHGPVSRAQALSALRGAGVAVVITSVFDDSSLEDDGIVTGKVFEVLGLGTPILLVAPSGSDARAVVEQASGSKGFTGNDIEGMESFLRHAMLDRNPPPRQGSPYAWPHIARNLDAILRRLL